MLATDPSAVGGNDGMGMAAPLSPSVSERIAGCRELAGSLRQCGAEASVDLGELHASEFHDGPSFVIRHPQGQLLGDGGCYGRFASTFMASPTAAYAAVIGLERLVDIVPEHEQHDRPSADLAVLATPEPEVIEHADQLNATLRRSGISVWDVIITRPIRQHLRDLGDLAIPYSVLIGSRELSVDSYTVRDREGNLHVVDQQHLADWIVSEGARRLRQARLRPGKAQSHSGGPSPSPPPT